MAELSNYIPKIVHYVWVGPRPLTPLAKRCIASWYRYLPDYQFKLWNEQNVPMDNPYVQAMHQKGRWAFVADYIRFWALEREGGIYLDTDTEVLKSFDSLLSSGAFFGRTKDGVVAAGVIGAKPHHPCIQDILAVYDTDTEYSTERTSPRTVTDVLQRQQYSDVRVYGYEYFNPCDDGEPCTAEKLTSAYTHNHWAESWVPFAKLRKLARRLGVMQWLKCLYDSEN